MNYPFSTLKLSSPFFCFLLLRQAEDGGPELALSFVPAGYHKSGSYHLATSTTRLFIVRNELGFWTSSRKVSAKFAKAFSPRVLGFSSGSYTWAFPHCSAQIPFVIELARGWIEGKRPSKTV
ncbi:hypothetical protein V6N13_015623 [Hibiscus sabdariffa]|uniref:Secreted protein n=1 Tax=Hibiscus sabdariffa TaxID=183260 RepID=A0ABR2CWN9_9ROSI